MAFRIDPDITRAQTPPTDWYTSESAYRESQTKIFARSWQWITDRESVKVPGAVLPFPLLEGCLDEPLMFVRDRNDTLRCLSNVCTHRGNLVVEGAGTVNSLRCRYHGRRWGLDGGFQFMPEFDGVADFPSPCDNLASVPHAEWKHHLWTGLRPAASFDEWYGPMQERLDWLPLEEFRHAPEFGREYLVRGHWALYVDNYLEGFHIPYIHPALNETLSYADYRTELFRYGNLQVGVGKPGELCFELPRSSPDYGQSISAYYFWFFPNLMFNFYPWGLSVNVVRPVGPDTTKVRFIPYVWRPELRDAGAGGDLDRVEREDEAIIEQVQKGMRGRFYRRGRYAPVRELGTHHFHRLLAEFLTASDGSES